MSLVLMFIYLIIGIIFALITYYLIMNDDNYYRDDFFNKKSNVVFTIFCCVCFWIVILPFMIYSNIKEK